MSLFQKFQNFFKDDYRVGVESSVKKDANGNHTRKILYLTPDKIDSESVKRGKGGEHITEQLDEQHQGFSKELTEKNISQLTFDSLYTGPFSRKAELLDNTHVCLINEPKNREIDPDKIFTTFGLNDTFNPAHLKPLPGDRSTWRQFVGRHEGMHCNQESTFKDDPDRDIKTLNKEIEADRAALEPLYKEGKHDIAQAWIDHRVLTAADGDPDHATSIFLNDPNFTKAGPEHFDAAKHFRNEMNLSVAQSLNIPPAEAEKLRRADPQRYATVMENALEKGDFPVKHNIDEYAMQKRVTKEMGFPEKNVYKLQDVPFEDVLKNYKKLEAEGEFRDHSGENPHVKTYITQYIGATRRLFIEDTTPTTAATPSAAPSATATPSTTDPTPEEVAEKKNESLKEAAQDQAYEIMTKTVTKSLNLSEEEAEDLLKNDPDRYYDTVEAEMKKGEIPYQSYRYTEEQEENALMAKKFDVPVKELEKQPSFMKDLAKQTLLQEEAFWVKEDNPYLKTAMEERIREHREEKLGKAPENQKPEKEPRAENKTSSASPASPSERSSFQATAPAALSSFKSGNPALAQSTGSYDILSERPSGPLGNGGLRLSEHFASQASPNPVKEELNLAALQKHLSPPDQNVMCNPSPNAEFTVPQNLPNQIGDSMQRLAQEMGFSKEDIDKLKNPQLEKTWKGYENIVAEKNLHNHGNGLPTEEKLNLADLQKRLAPPDQNVMCNPSSGSRFT